MTISELICRLQAVKCEHGDLEVLFFGDTWYQIGEVKMKRLMHVPHVWQEFACIEHTSNRQS